MLNFKSLLPQYYSGCQFKQFKMLNVRCIYMYKIWCKNGIFGKEHGSGEKIFTKFLLFYDYWYLHFKRVSLLF